MKIRNTNILIFYSLILFFSGTVFAQKVGILRSWESKNLIKKQQIKDFYDSEVDLFQQALESSGIDYKIFGDYELSTKIANYDGIILIFPDFDDPIKINMIKEYLSRGKRILIIGNSLRKDKNFFLNLPYNCQVITPKPFKKQMGRYFVVKGNTFLSLNMIPAIRFEIEASTPQFVATDKNGFAFYVNWDLDPFDAKKGFFGNTGMSLFRCGVTEILWIGFPLSGIVDSKMSKKYLPVMKQNIARWLSGAPLVGVPYWPLAKDAVIVVEADVEHMFENGEALAITMKKYGIKGTFFVVGELAKKYPEVVSALADNGEVGCHSMHHQSYKKLTLEQQYADLKECSEVLKKIGIKKMAGFRPPYEDINKDTLKALKKMGVKLIYGLLDYSASYPVIHDIDGFKIYQFPRIVVDDYNIIAEKKGKSRKDYFKWFKSDLQKMILYGGIFPFSIHTNYLLKKNYLPVLKEFLDYAIKQNVLFYTFSDIINWIEKRESVSIAYGKDGFTVSNSSEVELKDFPIIIYNLKDALFFDNYVKKLKDGGVLLSITVPPKGKLFIPYKIRDGFNNSNSSSNQ